MCGGSSSQQANTTNLALTQQGVAGSVFFGGNVGNGTRIGLTGDDATALARIMTRAGVAFNRDSLSFSSSVQGRAYDSLDRSFAQSSSQLASIIDATRDFSARALAAGTGQQTPIINLPPAGSSVAVVPSVGGGGGGGGSPLSPTMLLAVAGLAVAVMALKE